MDPTLSPADLDALAAELPAAAGSAPGPEPSASAAAPADPCAGPAARLPWLPRASRWGADALFLLLLVALVLLAGWLVARHDRSSDWSSDRRNSLSAESLAVLAGLAGPVRITVYGPPTGPLARAIEQVLLPYQRARPDLEVEHIDPALFPEQARAANVKLFGQLVLEYQGRRETLGVLSESALTNAIARLALADPPRVVVLEGHGERAIAGAAGTDLGRFAQLLHQRGFRLQPLDLTVQPAIPDNTDLVLASMPAIALFPGAAEALVGYLERGGNLFWLLDPAAAGAPDDLLGYEPVAAVLGLAVLPGLVVDARADAFGFDTPTVAVVADWPQHLVTEGLGAAADLAALLPGSLALTPAAAPDWRLEAVFRTGATSWNETGPIQGEVTRQEAAGEQAGPLAVGLLLSRPQPGAGGGTGTGTGGDGGAADAEGAPDRVAAGADREQRVAVFGDGDWLSSARLASGANQALALRVVRWLSGREDLVRIPAPPSDREPLLLDPDRGRLIAAWGLFALPALFALVGFALRWWRGRG